MARSNRKYIEYRSIALRSAIGLILMGILTAAALTSDSYSETVAASVNVNNSTAVSAALQSSTCPTCPQDIIVTNTTGFCGAIVNYTIPAQPGCPTGISITSTHPPGTVFPVGTTTVTLSATFSSTFVSTCTFTVTVIDAEQPNIVCPSNLVVNALPGQSFAVVNYLLPPAFDNCGRVDVISSPPPGARFPLGATPVSITATDINGNSTVCNFTITVVDREPPIIDCPSDIVVKVPAGRCEMPVRFPAPVVRDGSDVVSIDVSPPSGSIFPVGLTRVNVTAIDRAGNVARCSFNVRVDDGTPPRVIVPADIVKVASADQCSAIVDYPPARVSDECSEPTVTYSVPAGSLFPVGVTKVLVTATDRFGNVTTGSFNVTVEDKTPPTFVPPSNIIVDAVEEECAAVVVFPRMNVFDECSSVSVSYSVPSGSRFNVGTTNVIATITDQSGNRTTGAFTVEVLGKPQARLVPDDSGPLEFGPLTAARKPRRNPPIESFSIRNSGCSLLTITFVGMSRRGESVDTGRISNVDDSRFFSVEMLEDDGFRWPVVMGQTINVRSSSQRNMIVLFNPVIPRVAASNRGLTADLVLPDVVFTQIDIEHNSGPIITVTLVGRVDTALQLIDPDDPRRAPKISFNRIADLFVVDFSVHDANLDVRYAVYQFIDKAGRVVGKPITVDLTGAIAQSDLTRGQSFSVSQAFSGADDYKKVTGVRVTVYDGETNVIGTSAAAGSITTLTEPSRVTVVLPEIKLPPVATE